jgi:hypothetical protein
MGTDHETLLMKRTPWKEYREDGRTYRIRAEYGWHRIGTQEPYWSVTGTIERRTGRGWADDAGGCLHEEIAQHFPRLAPTIKWHLAFQTAGPLHYVANARHWLEQVNGIFRFERRSYDPDPVAAFKSTVVFGAIPGDEIPTLDGLEAWCAGRLPALVATMTAETNAVLLEA